MGPECGTSSHRALRYDSTRPAKARPPWTLDLAGSLFVMLRPFHKSALTLGEQAELLRQGGPTIDAEGRAQHLASLHQGLARSREGFARHLATACYTRFVHLRSTSRAASPLHPLHPHVGLRVDARNVTGYSFR